MLKKDPQVDGQIAADEPDDRADDATDTEKEAGLTRTSAECLCDTELATGAKADFAPDTEKTGGLSRPQICLELQKLQKQRRRAMAIRIKLENCLTSQVAVAAFDYDTSEDKGKLEKARAEAAKLIKRIDKGDIPTELEEGIIELVEISTHTRAEYRGYEDRLLAAMTDLASQLSVAAWLDHVDRRGIGLTMLATIIGEAGDLSNYANPAKLWRRMVGAPHEKRGKVKMPSQWRREGGLSGEEWSEIGYSPRRNGTMYQLRINIVMQNQKGPYRARYDEAKARTKEKHPDKTDLHCHNHGMLLAAKRLLRDLWREWHRLEGGEDVKAYEKTVDPAPA